MCFARQTTRWWQSSRRRPYRGTNSIRRYQRVSVRYAPLAPMSPFEDTMGSDVHKTKTLLLENYKNMHSKMHDITNERDRIKKMITELEGNLKNVDVYIEDFK